jgi:hypothetical protein
MDVTSSPCSPSRRRLNIRNCIALRCQRLLPLAAIVVLSACQSQQTKERADVELPKPLETLSDGYSLPWSIVERGDHTVLVADRKEWEIWRVDFASGDRQLLGSTGDGPGEFRWFSEVLTVHEDSIAVVAFGAPYKLALLSPSGRPVRTVLLSDPAGFDARGVTLRDLPMFSRSDANGNLYGAPSRGPQETTTNVSGSRVPIVRLALSDGRSDTLAWMPIGESNQAARDSGSVRRYRLSRGLYSAANDWAVFPDGTIVWIDAATYTLTFSEPSGRARVVKVNTPETIPVNPKEFEAYTDSSIAEIQHIVGKGMSILSGGSGARKGNAETQFIRPAPPTQLPPVLANAVRRILATTNQLWVPVAGHKSPAAEYWDVLDTLGVRRGRFALPSRTELRAVSSRYVYTVRKDDDDLYWVERRRNPVADQTGHIGQPR